jgi:hypothetical protein
VRSGFVNGFSCPICRPMRLHHENRHVIAAQVTNRRQQRRTGRSRQRKRGEGTVRPLRITAIELSREPRGKSVARPLRSYLARGTNLIWTEQLTCRCWTEQWRSGVPPDDLVPRRS